MVKNNALYHYYEQRIFEALCHNTAFVLQTEFLKGRSFEKISRGSGGTL